jgi:hypothetical protein
LYDPLFEHFLTEQINEITYRLNMSLLRPGETRDRMISRLKELTEQREKTREVFKDDQSSPHQNQEDGETAS